jgi:hypothetical protein
VEKIKACCLHGPRNQGATTYVYVHSRSHEAFPASLSSQLDTFAGYCSMDTYSDHYNPSVLSIQEDFPSLGHTECTICGTELDRHEKDYHLQQLRYAEAFSCPLASLSWMSLGLDFPVRDSDRVSTQVRTRDLASPHNKKNTFQMSTTEHDKSKASRS